MPSVLPNLTPLWKAPTKRIFRPDEINSTSYKNLEVKDYSQLNESTLQYLDGGYLCSTCEDHIVFYKMEKTTASIPVVTESIRIDAKLHVQLYFKGCPLPLPPWFREGRNCKLTSLTQLENNFPSYIRATSELISDSISEELATTQTIYEERTLFHCIDSICSNASITSLQSYKLLLHLPSISYLRKMKQGNLKILKSAKMLLDFNSISKDVVLMFDEIIYKNGRNTPEENWSELTLMAISTKVSCVSWL